MSFGSDPVGPTHYAHVGIIEGIKARNPIYAVLLRCMNWMVKLPPLVRWGVVIGGLIGQKILGGISDSVKSPAVAWLPAAVMILYVVFAILIWLAQPVFNLLLRLHPLGRRALSAEDVRETNWIGGYFATALFCVLLSFVPGWDLLQLPALCLALSTMPLFLVFRCSEGGPRVTMIGVVAALGILTIVWPVAIRTGEPDLEAQFGNLFWLLFIGGIVGGQLIAGVRVKR